MSAAATTAEEYEMVYTEARLEHALAVFRASEPYRKRRNLSADFLQSYIESKSRQYETRSGNKSYTVGTSISVWHDRDDSDGYTPKKKKSVPKPRDSAQNGQKRKRRDVNGYNGHRLPKRSKANYTAGRQNGYKLRLTFKFSSDTARARLAELFPVTPDPCMDPRIYRLSDNEQGDVSKDACIITRYGPQALERQPASCAGRQPIAQKLKDDETEIQYLGSVSRATHVLQTPRSTPSRVPTASQSDPIIIDDSDGSSTNQDYKAAAENKLPKTTRRTKIISTNWAHPIEYRCNPEACNFCNDCRYAMFGCGPVKVEVIQLEPGLYEEMGGGQRERGCAPTRICLPCCLERIAIAECPGHTILHAEGYDEKEVDAASFIRDVTALPFPKHPACSVCISPAFYACGTRQQEDTWGFPVVEGGRGGCGLLLCRQCAALVESRGFDMGHLERAAGRSLRADREFLLPGSDLWQASTRWNSKK